MKGAKIRSDFRKKRVRSKISGTSERPRLNVKCGQKHIYAQIIDDTKGFTIAAASTLSEDLKGKLKSTDTIDAAKAVGKLIAQKAIEKNVKLVVFDRAGRAFVGKVKALADEARAGGLEF
ncbi:MAG: 50S ribosomal protein L18 [Endomicrobiaceae bacterium]|jgi:large subunit ribosomal protein L18|nr:50S ribosomal protein L18 [Endomicrobiaceae bacterium]MDD3053704.1 50S ribosomal protein L18 [Endomicrobiaceae bacterium]MDD3922713.1 50S ribosomal protein L18 [Endomicrobiaceae bacterium]MDD5102529.1 50S ribosomal protein L18 [Endomicrobiaceae bacterium]